MADSNLTAERLRELLSYDPETGIFTWRMHFGRVKSGTVAGCLTRGYIAVRVNKRMMFAHRLAWLHAYGRWPIGDIDHINGVRNDNRLVNLRECNRSENKQNSNAHKDNKSGFMGVSKIKGADRWRSEICVNRKNRHLGSFKSPELAYAAYLEAKASLHAFQPTIRATV